MMGKLVFVSALLGLFCTCSALLSDSEARSQLSAAGISQIVASNHCSERYTRGCTSLEGIRENTINGLIALKQASGCDTVITGGTEYYGHSRGSEYSHFNGYKIDLRKNSCYNTHLRSYTYIGRRGGDRAKQYRTPSGNIFAEETNPPHWDLLFHNGYL